MLASFKFIQKFWMINNQIKEKIQNSTMKKIKKEDLNLIKIHKST